MTKPKNTYKIYSSSLPWEETFDARKLLAIPLLCLAAYCLYAVITGLSMNGLSQIVQAPYIILLFPPFPAIFVGVFSCLAIYMLIRGKSIGKIATVVAWIFTVISVWTALSWYGHSNPGSNPSSCEGLFGVMQNCADTNLLQVYILFLNPFSLGFYSLLSIVGIVIMAKRLKKQR